jgi:hypothetical protein
MDMACRVDPYNGEVMVPCIRRPFREVRHVNQGTHYG